MGTTKHNGKRGGEQGTCEVHYQVGMWVTKSLRTARRLVTEGKGQSILRVARFRDGRPNRVTVVK